MGTNITLDDLPLFATDEQIAIAIVGEDRAGEWTSHALPMLEAKGFPQIDIMHQGRPIPLVKKWYDHYLGVKDGYSYGDVDAEESKGEWKNRSRFSKAAKAEKTVAGPITPEELEAATRRREKRLQQEAARARRLRENVLSE
jgi:hypothetical protein